MSGSTCVHRWQIASKPKDGVLAGRCLRCHAYREFPAVPNHTNTLRARAIVTHKPGNTVLERSRLAKLAAIEQQMENLNTDI